MPLQTLTLEFFHDNDESATIHVILPNGKCTLEVDSLLEAQVLHGVIEENAPPKVTVTAKRQRRSSMWLEDSLAEELGGKRQKGSGAVLGLKGDVLVRGKFRAEQKHTRSASYRVTREELNKIRGECEGLEIPLFVIDFLDPRTGGNPDRWVMVPLEEFKKLEYKPAHESGHHR